MKCQKCKEREANVQIMQQELGKKPQSVMLCDVCARDMGVTIPTIPPGVKLNNPFAVMGNAFQTTFGLGAEEAVKPRVLRCTSCKLTFDQFRKEGFLGCPQCYEAFGVQLDPVFCRTQMGKKHVGRKIGEASKPDEQKEVSDEEACTLDERLGIDVKVPKVKKSNKNEEEISVASGPIKTNDSLAKTERAQRKRMIAVKQRHLKAAVEKEEYMEAARLRDEIAELKKMED